MLDDLVAKYTSTEVTNIPPSKSVINVCARGSLPPLRGRGVIPSPLPISPSSTLRVDVFVLDDTLSSLTVSLLICASLVAIINSCFVSITPEAVYVASPLVEIRESSFELVELEVNLNTLSPVLHLGFEFTLGSGIAKVPDTEPLASVIKEPPSEPPLGVTYAVAATLSKKG